jgi:hypothetical protein
MTSYLLDFLLVAFGALIGIKFADIDLAPVLRIGHRSAWTHGPFTAWLVIYLITPFPWLYWLAVGFLPANAIHLLADMFPRNWKGGAMIKLYPIKRQLSPILSFAWLGLGAWISFDQWMEITSRLWGWWIF